MTEFKTMTINECESINGGGVILAGLVIVGGCILIAAASFAVGYGLAVWLG